MVSTSTGDVAVQSELSIRHGVAGSKGNLMCLCVQWQTDACLWPIAIRVSLLG